MNRSISEGLASVRACAGSVPLIVWGAIAACVFAGLDFLHSPGHLAGALSDSDDATRLIQVRELLAGAPWFDTSLKGLGAPDALVSHWSRLVDLPLAALFLLFGSLFTSATAEWLTRIVWPLALFVGLLWFLARAAEERAGRTGAVIALVLAVLCFSGTTQFAPGRIDHHNILILALVSGVLLLVRSFEMPRLGWFAGAALGFGTAVGFEALPLTIAALASAGLVAIGKNQARDGVLRAAAGFSAMLAGAFLLTVAPARWGDVRCDALSANLVVLAIICTAGLAAALFLSRPIWMRLVVLAAGGFAGIAIFGTLEPACLSGPFGQVLPEAGPIWLDHVSEAQSLWWLLGTIPAAALAFAFFAGLGLAAAVHIHTQDRDCGTLLYGFVLLAAASLSLWQVKFMPYAAFLAVVPLAIVLARLPGHAKVSAATLRTGAVALGNQQTVLILAALIFGTGPAAYAENMTARRGCVAAEAVAPLRALPPGLIAADADLGPFLRVATKHTALAAPYHRLDSAILDSHAILFGNAQKARGRLAALGANYVVVCKGLESTKPQGELPDDALKPTLLGGRAPDFLEPVPLTSPSPLKVWRVFAPGAINPRP
jgi:hypothetical protein